MNCIHHPLNADGSWHLYSKEELEEMGKRDQKLEDDFWKRFPDIYIDDNDFLFHWTELVYCETRDELQKILKVIEDENRESEEYYKNQKTSIWQRLFGH